MSIGMAYSKLEQTQMLHESLHPKLPAAPLQSLPSLTTSRALLIKVQPAGTQGMTCSTLQVGRLSC